MPELDEDLHLARAANFWSVATAVEPDEINPDMLASTMAQLVGLLEDYVESHNSAADWGTLVIRVVPDPYFAMTKVVARVGKA